MTATPPELPQPRRAQRLPSGRHGLSRRFVARNQRERLLAAAAQAVAERGYIQATVADITRIAGVSTRTFYDHFDNKHECFMASYDEILSRLGGAITAAYSEQHDWGEKIRSGIEAFIEFVLAERHFARACLVEAHAAGAPARRRRENAVSFFSSFFEPGRAHAGARGERALPRLATELVIGGLYEVICSRLVSDHPEQLREDLPDMVYCALLPFIGPEQAAETAFASAAGTPATQV